jgi:hypothetical protein
MAQIWTCVLTLFSVKLVGKSNKIIKKCMIVKYKATFNAYVKYPYLQQSSDLDFQKQSSNVGGNDGSLL